MDSRKLIELVREHSELYDLSNRNYSDNALKEKTWAEIARKLNRSAYDCKRSWINLRDSYRRSIKKRKETNNGQIQKNVRKWKFEEQMFFLQPHLQERSKMANVDISNIDTQEEENDCENEKETEIKQTQSPPTTENTNLEDDKIIKYKQKKLKSSLKKNESTSALLKKVMLDKQNEFSMESNAVDSFLSGIAVTLKSFSPFYQNIAKREIFNLVSQMEMQQIVNAGAATSFSDSVPLTPENHLSLKENYPIIASTQYSTDSESSIVTISSKYEDV